MNFGEQIWCVLSEEMSFETFTPIWFHVNENEKKKNQNPTIEISQFFERLLVEILSRSMHDFLGSESVVYFQRRCRLNIFSYMVPC